MAAHKIHSAQQMPGGRQVVPAENKSAPAGAGATAPLLSPSLVGVTDGKSTGTGPVSADLTTAAVPAPPAALATLSKQPSSNPPTHRDPQTSKPSSTSSKFVWVKTQNAEGAALPKSSRSAPPAAKTVNNVPPSAPGAESAAVHQVGKKTAAKKPPQKTPPDRLPAKTSKYKWVSSAASQANVSRKPLLPKGLPPPQKALETGGVSKKVKAAPASPGPAKKEAAASSGSSRYSWKAAAAPAGGAAARRRSSFHWTPDKRNRGARGGSSLPPPSASPGAFKLRSRMKIIRRSVNDVLQEPLQTDSN